MISHRDSILEYVTAGTILDAKLSAPVLKAILTSPSPLHDEAVVVRENRLLGAGVVLPLSIESEDTIHGTGHRAARGLARATDALMVCENLALAMRLP